MTCFFLLSSEKFYLLFSDWVKKKEKKMAAEGELDLDAKMKYKITAIEKRKEMREENISKVLNT